MPLSRQADTERRLARRRERPDPPSKTRRGAVSWATAHYPIRVVRGDKEAWQPVRYLADLMRVATLPQGPTSIAVWKGSQLGFTQLVGALYGWHLLERDSRVMVVMPTDGEARKYARNYIAPLYRRVAALGRLRDSTEDRNAVKGTHKVFDTGASAIVQGGGTADRYRSQAVDLQILDELDAYPDDLDEGDVVALSSRAVQNTGGLLLVGSTPTSARGPSQIVDAWKSADVGLVWAVRCPVCQQPDVLAWERMSFAAEGSISDRAATARMACGRCGAEWKHRQLKAAIEGGHWQQAALDSGEHFPHPVWEGLRVATVSSGAGRPRTMRLLRQDGTSVAWPRHIGCAIDGLPSVWAPWTAHVARWLRAQGDPRKLRAFTEQVLARPFAAQDGESEVSSSEVRRHAIPVAEVPDDHRLAVCAVDVQDGWLSVAVFLFGPRERAVLVEQTEYNGDVDRVNGSAWLAFRRWLESRPIVQGRPIRIVVVDTGFQSDTTVRNCRKLPLRATCVKGAGGWDRPTYRRSKTVAGGIAERLFVLGVDALKLTVSHRFAVGDMRIADHLPEKVADELAGERLKWVQQQGRRRRRWVQDAERIEAFDCAVYALAAVRIANVADIPALPLVGDAPRRGRRTVADRLAATGHRVRGRR